MSDNGRPCDRDRDSRRDNRRDPRDRYGRGNTPSDWRNRSRSPRRDRGGGGDSGRAKARGSPRHDSKPRNRSPSPFRRDASHRNDNPQGNSGSTGRIRNDQTNNHTRTTHNDRARTPPKGHRPSNNTIAKLPSAPRGNSPAHSASPADMEMQLDGSQKPEDMDDFDWELQCTMGFGGFKTTKNSKVPGNERNYGVRKDKRMEARQYMNRQGGFNRPLSPSRG